MRVAAPLALAVLILAGCASPPPHATCTGPSCPSGPASPSNNGPGPTESSNAPGPSVNITLPDIVLKGCHGLDAFASVPFDTAKDYVPDAFDPAGAFPFTAALGVEAFSCREGATPNATLNNVAFLATMMSVAPKNHSWANDQWSYYAYDFLVTDERLAQNLKRAAFTGAALAAFTQESEPNGDTSGEVWEFKAQGVDYKVTFGAASQAQGSARNLNTHFWNGVGPFTRTDAKESSQAAAPFIVEGSLVQVTGSSTFHDALGADVAPLQGAANVELRWDIQAQPILVKK